MQHKVMIVNFVYRLFFFVAKLYKMHGVIRNEWTFETLVNQVISSGIQ
jgi:hypothetical protein